jgi:hypothetical protein
LNHQPLAYFGSALRIEIPLVRRILRTTKQYLRISLIASHPLLDNYPWTFNLSGVLQLGRQLMLSEEEKVGLAAASPLPNPTYFSPSPPDRYIAHFREIHPYHFFNLISLITKILKGK